MGEKRPRTVRFFFVVEVEITDGRKWNAEKLTYELPQWFGGIEQPGYKVLPVTTVVPIAEGE